MENSAGLFSSCPKINNRMCVKSVNSIIKPKNKKNDTGVVFLPDLLKCINPIFLLKDSNPKGFRQNEIKLFSYFCDPRAFARTPE